MTHDAKTARKKTIFFSLVRVEKAKCLFFFHSCAFKEHIQIMLRQKVEGKNNKKEN